MLRKPWAAGLVLAGALAVSACGGPAQSAVEPPATEAAAPQAATAAGPAATSALSPLPTPGVAESPLPEGGAAVTSAVELEAALTAAGAAVEVGDSIEQPFFEVQGRELKVNGQSVQVFEWADEASREAVSQNITPEGQFGTAMIDWVGTPHFWASGKLIVLYVGDDPGAVSLLTTILGAPITK